jgi:hypothetical protein
MSASGDAAAANIQCEPRQTATATGPMRSQRTGLLCHDVHVEQADRDSDAMATFHGEFMCSER